VERCEVAKFRIVEDVLIDDERVGLRSLIGHTAYLNAVVDGGHGRLDSTRLVTLESATFLRQSVSTAQAKGSFACGLDEGTIEKEITYHELAELLQELVVNHNSLFDRLNDQIATDGNVESLHGDFEFVQMLRIA
jgi:hypothetical protein